MATTRDAVRTAIEGLLQRDKRGEVEVLQVSYEGEVREFVDRAGNVVRFPSDVRRMVITYKEKDEK